jgi:formamidopyrimidine-DNA glycosylase
MLAGRLAIVSPGSKRPGDTAVAFALDDGRTLAYRDDVQMGKVYVADRGAHRTVPGLAQIGVDCLDPKKFTRTAFRALAAKRRDQAKVFLLDKAALDSLGNAYADEALFEARIHPKAWVKRLSPEQVDALHDAIVTVLGRARDTIRAREPPIDEKLRDFLSVRGRAGEACVRCGTKLRKAGVHGHDAVFCPTCQPDDRGSSLVDWRKLPSGS